MIHSKILLSFLFADYLTDSTGLMVKSRRTSVNPKSYAPALSQLDTVL